jgi:putative ABC transport system ATP-binding protein
MTEDIIKAVDVGRVYDNNTRALNGVSFGIRKGEWVTIMGPSGSGKTTLLNILGGLDKPNSGRVKINRTDITGLNSKAMTQFRRENIGFIFQQFHLVPYLTALENVLLAQYFHSIVVEDDAKEALARVGLSDRLTHLPSELSGGEQQRVAVARALANEPDILLADEPTGNLDQANGKVVLDLLESLHREGHTIIMITHEEKLASRSERIIRMVDGKIDTDESTGKTHTHRSRSRSKSMSKVKQIGG